MPLMFVHNDWSFRNGKTPWKIMTSEMMRLHEVKLKIKQIFEYGKNINEN